MIESSIENLFTEINNSNEYKEYINIVNILKENKEVNKLIEEVKSLEKKATKLEYEKNKKYIEIDKQIEEKTKILYSNKDYQEYLSKLKTFNNTLLASSSLLDEYIEEKLFNKGGKHMSEIKEMVIR